MSGALLLSLIAQFLARRRTATLIRWGRVLGAIWFHAIRVRRGVAERAVARAFPDKSRDEARAIVKANFQHLLISLFETLAYIAYSDAKIHELIRFEGVEESVHVPRAAGKGVVAISAHIGNFEMCTDACGFVNRLPMLLVARLPKGGIARAILEAFRQKNPQMEVFEPKGSAPKVIAALREKRSVLAFVIDQNLRRGRGIFIPFLGEIANTTTGFASLQRKADAALCVVEMYRETDGTHRLHVRPVPPSNHPNARVAMLNDTLTMSGYIESFVRRHPEQWFWVHRRWKARPEPGDLVRTPQGLERFERGRIAAFISFENPEQSLATPAVRESLGHLVDAGVATFLISPYPIDLAGTRTLASLDDLPKHVAGNVDLAGAFFAGAAARTEASRAGIASPDEVASFTPEAAAAFLERVVGTRDLS